MQKLAYIDLETSGLDSDKDEVIRFSALIVNADGKSVVFDKYAKPKKLLTPAIETLTGITQADIENCEPSDIVKEEFLKQIEGATVVGYNLDFDERFLKITFTDKVEVSKLKKEDAKIYIAELKKYISRGVVSTIDVQCALQCGYPAAKKIIDAFSSPLPWKEKYDDNFFKLSEADRVDYLTWLVNHTNFDGLFKHDPDFVFQRLRFEIIRIQDRKLVTVFLVAKAVADVLAQMNELSPPPNFIGIGCCSLIAYLLGITYRYCDDDRIDLNPIEHDLIFQRAFPKEGSLAETLFGFYVEKNDCDKLVDELKKRFGENVTLVANDIEEFILSVNGIKIKIITSLAVLQELYFFNTDKQIIDQAIDTSSIAMFQEDYMRLLHLMAGYDYDEANNIRRDICAMKNLNEHKNDFLSKTNVFMTSEFIKLYDNIVKGWMRSHCKAWLVSVKAILDFYHYKN